MTRRIFSHINSLASIEELRGFQKALAEEQPAVAADPIVQDAIAERRIYLLRQNIQRADAASYKRKTA